MQSLRTSLKLGAVLALSLPLYACAMSGGGGSNSNLFSSASIAEQTNQQRLPQHLEMDVGIIEFDPNFTLEQAKEQSVYPEVRKAEAKRLPLRLKKALQESDYWSHVWIVPENAIVDIKVHGKIIESTGEILELKITAQDARGKVLINKTYEEKATKYDYSAGREPFANLFKRIAADLQKAYRYENHSRIAKLKSHTDVRFANWIAPAAFAHHIERGKVVSEPDTTQMVYQQALRLREHDALFFDKLQDYYDDFEQKTRQSHQTWLRESYTEIAAQKKERSKAVMSGLGSAALALLGAAATVYGVKKGSGSMTAAGAVVTAGGAVGIADSVSKYRASKVHDDAIRELAASAEISLKPHTIEIEGKKIQLVGSVEQQYLRWHEALQQQYHLESQDI